MSVTCSSRLKWMIYSRTFYIANKNNENNIYKVLINIWSQELVLVWLWFGCGYYWLYVTMSLMLKVNDICFIFFFSGFFLVIFFSRPWHNVNNSFLSFLWALILMHMCLLDQSHVARYLSPYPLYPDKWKGHLNKLCNA